MTVQERRNWISPKMRAVEFMPPWSINAEIIDPHPGQKMLRMKRIMCQGSSTLTIEASQALEGSEVDI